MKKNGMITEDELIPYNLSNMPEGPYLVFAPHPDDETLGMGGMIALATGKGIAVHVVFMTNGDMGGNPDIRKLETRRAAEVLGISRIFYLGLRDRELTYEQLPHSMLETIFDELNPSVVFLPSFQEIHPDHRATTHKILQFMDYKSFNLSCREHTDFYYKLWFYEINRQGEVNALVDISSVMEIKEHAIECYASQLEMLDYKTQCLCLDYARSITLGEKISYVEGFWVHDPECGISPEQLYIDQIQQYFPLKAPALCHQEVFVHSSADKTIDQTTDKTFDKTVEKKYFRSLNERIKHQSMTLSRYVKLAASLSDVVNKGKALATTLGEENAHLKKLVDEMQEQLATFSKAKSHRMASAYIKLAMGFRSMSRSLFLKNKHLRSYNEQARSSGEIDNCAKKTKACRKMLSDEGKYPVVMLFSVNELQENLTELDIHRERFAHGMTYAEPLHSGRDVLFVLNVDIDDLASVQLFMTSFECINPGLLVLELYSDELCSDKNGTLPLRSSTVAAPMLLDNAFVSFCFEPVADSKDRTFYAKLSLKNGAEGSPVGLWTRPSPYFNHNAVDAYHEWIKKNENHDEEPDSSDASGSMDAVVTIIIPVISMQKEILLQDALSLQEESKTKEGGTLKIAMLQESFASVFAQSINNWEILVPVVGSSGKEIEQKMREIFDRIDEHYQSDKVIFVECNDNSDVATQLNLALERSCSLFFMFLHPFDTLSSDALQKCTKNLIHNADADIMYSDEDRINQTGLRFAPMFKPQWSPDLLVGFPYYPGGLTFFRKSLFKKTGVFTDLSGLHQALGFCFQAFEYDLTLRLSEITDRIVHIPEVLYHRRDCELCDLSSGAFYWKSSAIKAVEAALERRGNRSTIKSGLTENSFHVGFPVKPGTMVSIIIPFRDCSELLETAVKSILDKTIYPDYEIICINNGSVKPCTHELIDRLKEIPFVKVIDDDTPFNYSALNNRAVSHAEGEVLLFLNSDVEVISENWLEAMIEHTCRKEVGAVGALLYYVNDTIQHAGIVLGIAGLAGHAFKHVQREDTRYYYGWPFFVRNVSGVTGACMMIRRSLFEEIGGFDEKDFQVSYNDLDLCMRLRRKGYQIIYTPFAQLYHYESFSRGYVRDDEATMKIREKWGEVLDSDPFYNPNLTTRKEDWTLE
ncbi:hypothetical protein MTBBW1_2030058 [Desulfamplus magnetovallimortis]|uniref:Glycosyltransferase 2-like domain-containing protein n=1 Tax=Desulfamplus magnetovallimortis TaxID=1246637 RepID=A0A1W1HC62_9BACT|nr:glycosyltransferase [Desulfamplus magnetovallimortis]SLM29968.1 hypothetical protein MTBBW1_2030058 [Desulfamplus magnetovallimortis]